MKLSVIIVNYNTKKITLNCLKSLDKFPFKDKFEVILVDNGSNDGSVNVFNKYKPDKYLFKFVANDDNLGFAKANNQGIKRANGKYVLLLNSDTLMTKGSLTKLVDFAEKHADAGVVAPKLLNEDLTTQPSVFRFPTTVRTARQYWLGGKGLLDKYAPKSKVPVEVEVVVGAAFLITPKALKKVGPLNEKYFMFFEDFDYCREVKRVGLKIYYLPGVEIIHLHGKSGEKVAGNSSQWRRLIPSSKIYHGLLVHYLRWFIIRTGQMFN